MSLRHVRSRSLRKSALAGLALILTAGGVLAASPATAADNNLIGPIREYCTVAGKRVGFDVWLRWQPKSTRYAIDKFNWDTYGSFKPSRLVVSVRNKSGSKEDMVRVWGGSAATLRDVDARFSTKQPWEAAGKHALVDHNYIYSTVYLNAEQRCNINIELGQYW